MEKDKLKVGDVVMLKSGGPNMVIASIIADECGCVWFNADEKMKRATFLACVIEKVEEE